MSSPARFPTLLIYRQHRPQFKFNCDLNYTISRLIGDLFIFDFRRLPTIRHLVLNIMVFVDIYLTWPNLGKLIILVAEMSRFVKILQIFFTIEKS